MKPQRRSADLEYFVDLCQIDLASVLKLVDAYLLAIQQEQAEPHYLPSNKHSVETPSTYPMSNTLAQG